MVVIDFIFEGWASRFTETEFPNILYECIRVDVVKLSVDFYFWGGDGVG